jgi:hypothetical protein
MMTYSIHTITHWMNLSVAKSETSATWQHL